MKGGSKSSTLFYSHLQYKTIFPLIKQVVSLILLEMALNCNYIRKLESIPSVV